MNSQGLIYKCDQKQNRSVARPKGKVQPKMVVSSPGDQLEKEADMIADQVVKKKDPANRGPLISRAVKNEDFAKRSFSRDYLKATDEKTNDVKRKAESGADNNVSKQWTDRLMHAPPGEPLPTTVRHDMEDRFHSNLSAVKIHRDQYAANLNDHIGARAFTYANDIYFNSGEFAPATAKGKHLLAHELAHVMQQTGGASTTHSQDDGQVTIYRNAKSASANTAVTADPPPPAATFTNNNGEIELADKKFIIKNLQYVEEKLNELEKIHGKVPANVLYNKKDRDTQQLTLWTNNKKDYEEGLIKKIKKKGKECVRKESDSDKEYYFFRQNTRGGRYIIGTEGEIVDAIIRPVWTLKGNDKQYHVDHIQEWQVSGDDSMKNFWLWEAKANMSGGSKLANHIKDRIKELVKQAVEAKAIWTVPPKKSQSKFIEERADEVKKKYVIVFTNLVKGIKTAGEVKEHYRVNEIFTDAKGLDGLRPMKESEIHALKGSKSRLSVLFGNRATRNYHINVPHKGKETMFTGFDVHDVSDYKPDTAAGTQMALIRAKLFDKHKKSLKETLIDLPLIKVAGVPFLGKTSRNIGDIIKVNITYFSPVIISDAYIEDNEVGVIGKIDPQLSFLKGLYIDVIITGDDIRVEKTFYSDNFKDKLPSIFKLVDGELTLSMSLQKGLGISGELNFAIEKLGTGFIKGDAGINKGFSLLGGFEFEKGFFDKSSLQVGYKKEEGKEDGKWSFHGFAEKSGDKILKHARVDVNYENDVWTAKGEAETRLASIKKGIIEVQAGPTGTAVVADFMVGEGIPGVKGGNLHFQFVKKEDGTYTIAASASIDTKFPAIPNVTLAGFYNSDGTFLFTGTAKLHYGKFDGYVEFGITNQQVNEKGELTGKLGNKLVAFGKGEADFKMTDWLRGKIGVIVTPDAKVILAGDLRPDPHLPITKVAKNINKEFGNFSLPKFTIFGIPHIASIYVTASGGFFFNAGIGPLYLNNAVLSFNNLEIDHPENAVVEGKGQLDIPANAEVGVRATITAGAGIVVVDVNINFSGSIAFAVTANAGLDVAFRWSSPLGFELLQAIAYVKAKAELVAKLYGEFKVDLDLLLTTINLYTRKFDIGEKRWPLGLDLDFNFPLAFSKGESGEFELPKPESVKHSDPKVDEETVKKSALEDPPVAEPAPGKEKTIAKVHELPAYATLGSNWITNKYERYNYVKNLKNKYPNLDWAYLDIEVKQLDIQEFERLRSRLTDVNAAPNTKMGIYFRLTALENFDENHLYVGKANIAQLRNDINKMAETNSSS